MKDLDTLIQEATNSAAQLTLEKHELGAQLKTVEKRLSEVEEKLPFIYGSLNALQELKKQKAQDEKDQAIKQAEQDADEINKNIAKEMAKDTIIEAKSKQGKEVKNEAVGKNPKAVN